MAFFFRLSKKMQKYFLQKVLLVYEKFFDRLFDKRPTTKTNTYERQ
jgi:hypothetical protein